MIGNPEWTRDARFGDTAARRQNRPALDLHLGEWTRTHDPIALMGTLQQRRIPAAAVHDAADHARDPHWQARGFHQPTLLEGYGTFPLPSSPWILDGERLGVRLPPPQLGQHDPEIYSGMLGLSEAEIAELRRESYLGNVPLSNEL